MKQLTLNAPFTLSGKGLHSGLKLDAEFCPAPENHGYKIQRIDLEGAPVIDCLADFVLTTNRGTEIGRGDVTVCTIEHAMACLLDRSDAADEEDSVVLGGRCGCKVHDRRVCVLGHSV